MALPIFQSALPELTMQQTRWASQLNPLLALPTSSPSFLKDIKLSAGVNVINHRLGRTPIGWVVSDSNAAVTVYRSQPFNDLTLTLTSSGGAVVSLLIF